MPPKVEHKHHIHQPKPQPKPAPPPKPQPQSLLLNVNNRRSEINLYSDRQRSRLDAIFGNAQQQQERDNSLLIGGTAGSTAAQFEVAEQGVRDTGVIKIKDALGTPADFVSRVESDIQRLTPNSSVELRPADNQPDLQRVWDNKYGSDTLAVVHKPETTQQPRVRGHEQGYRLLNQLHNNPNEVTISYQVDNASAAPREYKNSFGRVAAPNSGSAVDVVYDPYMNVDLPVRNPDGTLTKTPSDSAIILGHELGHASHMQRGTQQNVDGALLQDFGANQSRIMGTQGKENVISGDDTFYREGDHLQIGLREEFRNVGMDGHRYGNEPTENSLRAELGIPERRVSYQENGFYPYQNNGVPININGQPGVNGYNEITPLEARVNQVSTRAQTFGDNALDGVRGSRNSALIGAGFNSAIALYQGKDAPGVATDALIGAGSGVAEEVIETTINGARSTASGMTNNAFRTAASQTRGAAVAGAAINTAFAIYDQSDNLQNVAMRSRAVGIITGEAVVGAASGVGGAYAGAMAGAAIGSIFPGVGTVVGGVVGFAVGAGVGYLADKGLRGFGVDTAIATGVTATYDAVADLSGQAGETIGNAAGNVAEAGKNLVGGAVSRLSSIFG